jgi:hypothetical protein
MNTHKTRIAAAYRQLTGERLKGRISAIESISVEGMGPALYATVRTTEGTYNASCIYNRPFTTPQCSLSPASLMQWVLRLVVPVDQETMMAWEEYENHY